MCGIVGVCFEHAEASPALIAGLRSLEYRGYDSAGIALAGSGLPTRRTRGRVDNLVALATATRCRTPPVASRTRAGRPTASLRTATRTRTASGASSRSTRHPRNHEALRTELSAKAGHDVVRFESETDSEVWVALIDDELGDSKMSPGVGEMVEAIGRAMARAKGSYALAIMHEAIPDRIFFARRESPLVVGIGEGGNYVASDIAALLELTHRFLYVEDGMLGWVSSTAHEVYDEKLQRVDLPVDVIEWDAEAVEKCGYEHFMLKEIEEQSIVVGNTLQVGASESGRVLPEFEIPDEELAQYEPRRDRRLRHRAPRWLPRQVRPRRARGDTRAGGLRIRVPLPEAMVGPKDIVLAISQSGETADTLGAMKSRSSAVRDRSRSATCGARVSAGFRTPSCRRSAVRRSASLRQGLYRAVARGASARAAPRDGAQGAERRRADPARRPLASRAARARLADRRTRARSRRRHREALRRTTPIFFFLGRGPDYPIALEGALKLKEISYLHAEGYPAGEMKHGPLALVSEDMVCVAIAGDNATYEKVLGNVQEVKTRGGTCVLITNSDKREAIDLADETILIPSLDPLIDPILSVVPLQYLAYYVALERGCDIDKPRNLAKSVTVE